MKIIKKQPFLIMAAVLLFIFLLAIYLLSEKQTEVKIPSFDKQAEKIITIPKNIHVPEPGESSLESDIAVPKAAMEGANGSRTKIRSFEISAENNSFSAKKIIVYEGDIVRIYFTPKDKLYDFIVPDFGIKQEAERGQTKLVEFQARPSGSFVFSCTFCGGKENSRFEQNSAKGALLIVPAT